MRPAEDALLAGSIQGCANWLFDSTQTKELIQKYGRVTPRVGDRFGPYELVELIGRGGMGIVFKALDAVKREVAIKFMLNGELATETDIVNFLAEAKRQSDVKHPNVVRVDYINNIDGQYFFAMPLFKRSLASSCAKGLLPSDWRARVDLIVQVAWAVHGAHERGLIHRDLKPGNILLDEKGVPHVGDFGLARRLDEPGVLDVVAGTVDYMAPEQARGSRDLKQAVDVYALGTMLFELLTGRLPFRGSAAEVLEQKKSETPAPPLRLSNPTLPAAIERICSKCLAEAPPPDTGARRAGPRGNPDERYATALELARDLECVLGRHPGPISIPPSSRVGRIIYAVRRHSTLAWSLMGCVAALLFIAFAVRWVSQAQELELDTNADTATGQAGAALFQLKVFADRLEQAAKDRSINRLAHASWYVDDPGEALKRAQLGFDAAFVLDAEGRIRAEWPVPPNDIKNKSYAFRDYFRALQGSKRSVREGAYVAPALRSERDGEMKFALSVPLFDEGPMTDDGKMVGALVALVAADSVFGNVRMKMQGGRVTALLGPRDIDRDEVNQPPREHFVVVTHDGLKRGQEVKLHDLPALTKLFRERKRGSEQFDLEYRSPHLDANYLDPVPGFEGRWLAAFAPVGRTGFVISVQTPRRALWRARSSEKAELVSDGGPYP